VAAFYGELLEAKELSGERRAALKAHNLYYLYQKVWDSDPHEADLFKAIFLYKVFSKYTLYRVK
jgi:hypothetical protein